MINIIPQDPFESWAVRIAQADAAMVQQAYWIAQASLHDALKAKVEQEREALVTGLEHLIVSGHAEETNMDVALRQARNSGIREAQAAIRARMEAGG